MNLKKIITTIILTFVLISPVGVQALECKCKTVDGENKEYNFNVNSDTECLGDDYLGGMSICSGKLQYMRCNNGINVKCSIVKEEASASNTQNSDLKNNSDNKSQNTYKYNEADWDLCTNPAALKTFKFIGNILRVAFILIPIILIVMGSIDLMKAVIAPKEDDIKKSYSVFIKRCLAAVIVFFVPIITNLVLDILNTSGSNCLTCVVNPSSCNTN